MFDFGHELTITYPILRDLHRIERAGRRERYIMVRSVRDLVSQPLTIPEFLRRPYLNRSRILLQAAYEPEIGEYRNFYLGSTLEYATPGFMRFGVYEPDGTRPIDLLSQPFEPAIIARRQMVRLLTRMYDPERFAPNVLRILCDDFQVIS